MAAEYGSVEFSGDDADGIRYNTAAIGFCGERGMGLSHWVQLSLTEGIGPILTARIVEAAGSAEAACAGGANFPQNIEGIGAAKSRQICEAMKRAGRLVEGELEKARAAGISGVCLEDEAYPA